MAPDDFPVVYLPYRRQAETYVDWQVGFRMRTIFLLRTERNVADIAPEIREVVTSFDAELPISIQPLTEILRGSLSNQRFYTGMLSAFGALALLLATSGVFAVMAYTVSRKIRELGIRLALGAHTGQLKRAELWRGAKLAGLGLLIGGAGGAWLSRFIAAFLHGVGALDPATYGLVAAIVLGAVLSAGYLPARRAAAVDPARSLRTE